jgi:hypothetical protein
MYRSTQTADHGIDIHIPVRVISVVFSATEQTWKGLIFVAV